MPASLLHVLDVSCCMQVLGIEDSLVEGSELFGIDVEEIEVAVEDERRRRGFQSCHALNLIKGMFVAIETSYNVADGRGWGGRRGADRRGSGSIGDWARGDAEEPPGCGEEREEPGTKSDLHQRIKDEGRGQRVLAAGRGGIVCGTGGARGYGSRVSVGAARSAVVSTDSRACWPLSH